MTTAPNTVWVGDTSAFSNVRRIPRVGTKHERAVFRALARLVNDGQLYYPPQVVKELAAHAAGHNFYPYTWATENKSKATQHGELYPVVKKVLADPQVKKVLDPTKVRGEEEADPYVLATALHLKTSGNEVVVLTEERKDRPDKLSLNTACGLLRVFCLPIEAFLVQQGVIQ